jgi:cytochrome d ubiquinol oxidase subunit II
LNVVWFWALAAMLTAYAALDGYDLGVGSLHLWIAHGDTERRITLNAIGPLWNGNEVWLIASGGMLVVSFPRVYASGFSGFYLALIVALWLLILRGVSIEFRSQMDNPLWKALWDVSFWLGSWLLTLLLGVALGNVVRGLPVGPDGYFQGSFALLLNPYSLLVGILSVFVLAWHGANYLRLKAEDALFERTLHTSARLWLLVVILTALTTVTTYFVRSDAAHKFISHPVALIFPAITLAGLVGGFFCRRANDRGAFRSSTLVIVGLMGSAAASIFPDLLTSTLSPAYSLSVYNASSSPHALRAAFIANAIGMVGVIAYSTYIHRKFRGKVRLGPHGY